MMTSQLKQQFCYNLPQFRETTRASTLFNYPFCLSSEVDLDGGGVDEGEVYANHKINSNGGVLWNGKKRPAIFKVSSKVVAQKHHIPHFLGNWLEATLRVSSRDRWKHLQKNICQLFGAGNSPRLGDVCYIIDLIWPY